MSNQAGPDSRNGFTSIPNELKQLDRWGLWRYVQVAGRPKPLKVPYTTHGVKADPTNPEDWGSFEAAVDALHSQPDKFSGIGFMLTSTDPIAGIDLDDCVMPDGRFTDHARSVLQQVDSYTEFSPSKKGLRIIAKTEWKPDPSLKQGAKKNGTELYFDRRYLTITGRSLPDRPPDIRLHTDVLKQMYLDLSGSAGHLTKALIAADDLQPANLPDDFLEKIRQRNPGIAGRIESEASALDSGADIIEPLYVQDYRGPTCDRSRNDMFIALWLTTHGYTAADVLAVLTHPIWFSGSKSRETGERYARTTVAQAVTAMRERVRSLPDAQMNNTELGNAERLIRAFGNNLRHCKPLGGWMVWSGTCWVPDRTRVVDQHLGDIVRSLHARSLVAKTPEKSAELKKWAMRSEDHTVWSGSLALAQGLEGVTKDVETFDRQIWHFPAANGVVNLQNGELEPHAREFYFTSTSPVIFDPAAKAPMWLEALELWLPDAELRTFVQRAAGYTLTGSTSEQVIFFLYGAGHNGKTTFIQIMQHILGRFCRRISTESITQSKGGNVGTLREQAAARLAGARMGVASEVERNSRLAEGWIKDFTGGGPISTKVLYADMSENRPTAKIWFDANHRPRVLAFVDDERADLDAFWRRFREIPFTVQVPADRRIKDFDRYLISKEGSGILNWMIEGCIQWQLNGLPVPEAIKHANAEYRAEVDLIRPFLDSWLVQDPTGAVGLKDMYAAYKRHCSEDGESPCSKKELRQRLMERGLKAAWRQGKEVWVGFRLSRSPFEYTFEDLSGE